MPHDPTAPDIVLPCRPGTNPELRYALRSIEANLPYAHIWIIGEWPGWLQDTSNLTRLRRSRRPNKYHTTMQHYDYACRNNDISDPFILWNDDFYLLEPLTRLPALHMGRLSAVMPEFKTWRSQWAIGMRDTAKRLTEHLPGQTLYCYDVHTPLTIHKQAMRDALDHARQMRSTRAPHMRTLCGNLARLGGTRIPDPKHWNKPERVGMWLSSHESTFDTAIRPTLVERGLTDRAPWEKPGIKDKTRSGPHRAKKHVSRRGRMKLAVMPDPNGRGNTVRRIT